MQQQKQKIMEIFIINIDEVFDAYYNDAEQEQSIHINKFKCGVYVDIQEEW